MVRLKQHAHKFVGKSPRRELKPAVQIKLGGIQPQKKRRFKPGTVALRDIRRYQRNGQPLIPRAPIERIARIAISIFRGGHDLRLTSGAIEALREAVQIYAVELFENTNLCALHAKRSTIRDIDMKLARRLSGGSANFAYNRIGMTDRV